MRKRRTGKTTKKERMTGSKGGKSFYREARTKGKERPKDEIKEKEEKAQNVGAGGNGKSKNPKREVIRKGPPRQETIKKTLKKEKKNLGGEREGLKKGPKRQRKKNLGDRRMLPQ